MGFIYSSEKQRFDAEWEVLSAEYRQAGFDEAGIEEMRDFDWELLKKRRTYENHVQPLPCEEIDDNCDESRTNLFKKFTTLISEFDETSFTGRHDWIMSMSSPELEKRLSALTYDEKELLTLLIFDGYTQSEIAALLGCSQVAICKKIKKLKKFLKMVIKNAFSLPTL